MTNPIIEAIAREQERDNKELPYGAAGCRSVIAAAERLGWRLVPAEPTQGVPFSMEQSGAAAMWDGTHREFGKQGAYGSHKIAGDIYRAMLEFAPCLTDEAA